MTNLEINQKIAEIKYGSRHTDKDHSPQTACADCFQRDLKNFAESIADAFELFEEFTYEIYLMKDRDGTFSMLEDGSCDLNEICDADTAPLAICKAWIEWKEAKN